MVAECVGFHSDFSTFMQSGHSKTIPRVAIITGLPFNSTYDASRDVIRSCKFLCRITPIIAKIASKTSNDAVWKALHRSAKTAILCDYFFTHPFP